MRRRIVFKQGDVLTVIGLSKTTNSKISNGERVVQTWHYSRGQFEVAQRKTSQKEFFSYDEPVCMDCPMSSRANGGCYTHSYIQYRGFLSQLRSIGKTYNTFDDIPDHNWRMYVDILKMCEGRFVRFGSYGEPSLLSYALVKLICSRAKSWTGYTHQFRKKPEYLNYFMASVHSSDELAPEYRSFLVGGSDTPKTSDIVSCPASKEMGYKSSCNKCGLCSGILGKGQKSILIFEH